MPALILIAIVVLYLWGEISVFAATSDALGDFGPILVILSTVATAAIGVRLYRIAGRATLRRFAEAAESGRPPVFEIADGGAITLAAVLLVLPGYITDGMGLILFIPGLRGVIGILLFTLIFAAMPRGNKVFSARFTGGHAAKPAEDGDFAGDSAHDTAAKKHGTNITIEGEFSRKN